MTSAQHKLIRTTFAKVLPFAGEAGSLFYQRLFEINPSLRPLFPANTEQQGRMLIQALAVMVKSVDRLDQIRPELEALGRRHARYGAKTEDYLTVREALLDTLAHLAGKEFSPEAKEAWLRMFDDVARIMQRAAAEVPPRERSHSA